ncbi:hypothetical protein PPACK8108_LOCUS22704 [Phakopsora pachyrhizi]|uniref:Uncharacterized protein n=1 Tax=Phakopsora pachyrhizi TaxID=170000 RepID=A0AAV0BNT9_PHAPC|nr:hypothetical protein PPACK8108_LOCUS22704 [Phakopsora pachyrhizi]
MKEFSQKLGSLGLHHQGKSGPQPTKELFDLIAEAPTFSPAPAVNGLMDDRIDIDQEKFMPGRLDFETEWEIEADSSIKDLSFGRFYCFGGNSQLAKALVECDHNLDLESSKQNPEVKPKQIDDSTKELEQPLTKRHGLGSE